MIIWIASYPKSGNTWLRVFISSILYSNDGIVNLENLKHIDQYPLISHFDGLIDNPRNINVKDMDNGFDIFINNDEVKNRKSNINDFYQQMYC